jgi:DNA-binding protein HU-beta
LTASADGHSVLLGKSWEEFVDLDLLRCHDSVKSRWMDPQHHSSTTVEIHLMNKAELVEAVQKSLGKETSKASAERALEAVIDGIKGGLKKGKPVQLVGFGTFKVAHRKARKGINPKTGASIKIKASKSVKFSAGKDLKSKL